MIVMHKTRRRRTRPRPHRCLPNPLHRTGPSPSSPSLSSRLPTSHRRHASSRILYPIPATPIVQVLQARRTARRLPRYTYLPNIRLRDLYPPPACLSLRMPWVPDLQAWSLSLAKPLLSALVATGSTKRVRAPHPPLILPAPRSSACCYLALSAPASISLATLAARGAARA